MIYYMTNSEDLLARLKGINDWIDSHKEKTGNANMYEIMACMIARNNIRAFEGQNNEALDAEIEKMLSTRKASIEDFQKKVPESKVLFDAVRNGFSVVDTANEGEMELICKCQSTAFYIYNTRRRGGEGDILMDPIDSTNPDEPRNLRYQPMPSYQFDNSTEAYGMLSIWDSASEEVKKLTRPTVSWIIDNSIQAIQTRVAATGIMSQETIDTGTHIR